MTNRTNPRNNQDRQGNQSNLTIAKSSRFEESIQKRIEENKAYNKAIFNEQDKLDQLDIQDNLFLVRCLKHEGEQTNDGLFIERKYQQSETENGRPTTKVDDYTHSTRTVVVKTPESFKSILKSHIENNPKDTQIKLQLAKAEQLKVGDIVWITPNVNPSSYAFFTDVAYPVRQFEGYLLVPQGLIQVKESKSYQEVYG